MGKKMKNPSAEALGRLGGLKSGETRRKKIAAMTPEQRREYALKLRGKRKKPGGST